MKEWKEGGDIPIVPEVVGELVFKFTVPDARSARAVAEGVARLNHELGNDAVEDHAVVVSAARVSNEVLDGLRCLLREKAHVHVPERCVDRRRRCEGRGVQRRSGRGSGDRLLFARRTLVEDVSVTRLRVTVPICQVERPAQTRNAGGIGLLGLAAREHVEALFFEARAEQCRVTHCLVRQDGVGRRSHRHGRNALLGRGALVQTQVHPAHGFVLPQEAHDSIRHGVYNCARAKVSKNQASHTSQSGPEPLIPNKVGYSTKAPLSSHTALIQAPGTFPSGPGSSSSFSTARRRPNSMSSTLYTAVPACCISWIAASDSSYFLVILPVRNENIRICRSGREKVTNDNESGERVMQVGVDADWKAR